MTKLHRLIGTILVMALANLAACNSTQRKPQVAPAPASPNPPSRPQVVDFAPGLRIDYRVPQVEIDAEVILRDASLELLLYSKAPTPKEHESILKTMVPSQRIFQALGLAGFKPGQPMRYFEDTGKVRPASGDPVDVLVRLERDGKIVEESANEWMTDAKSKSVMRPTSWLFTGSERTETGEFAADVEGTVITVVDFPSSLLSLPASHTSSDADLWLKANTPRIPPIGTRVVVILRAPATSNSAGKSQPG